jgi:hypothetical protein
MFDLEKSIADWRRQMLAAGIKTPVPLEELEIHLREEIERQMKSGTNPQQAFENSVQQIGHADELKGEFKKICGMKYFPQLSKWILQMDQWSLFWTGVLGFVGTAIFNSVMQLVVNLVKPFVHGSAALVFLSHPAWAVWLPNYVTFTTFTVSGLVIGFARWHTKWTLLWISSAGLIGAMMVNLVCLFVFHRSDGVSLFLQRVDLSWFFFYMNWTIFIIMGLFMGFSNWTLWLNKFIKTARD